MSNETIIVLLQNQLADLETQLAQLQHRADTLRNTISTLKNELSNVSSIQSQTLVQAQAANDIARTALNNAQEASTALSEQRNEFNNFIEHTAQQIESLAVKAQKLSANIADIPADNDSDEAKTRQAMSAEQEAATIAIAEQDAAEEQAIDEIEPEPIFDETVSDVEEQEIISDLQKAHEQLAEEEGVRNDEEPAVQEYVEEKDLEAPEPAEQTSIIPKISDIKAGISIGDRFLFQRQLFGNSGELMNKTIAKLNSMKSFDEALAWCNKNFDWDKDSNAFELFVNVLRRRF